MFGFWYERIIFLFLDAYKKEWWRKLGHMNSLWAERWICQTIQYTRKCFRGVTSSVDSFPPSWTNYRVDLDASMTGFSFLLLSIFLIEEADAQRRIGCLEEVYCGIKNGTLSFIKLRSALYLCHRSRCLMRLTMINLIPIARTFASSWSTFTASTFLDYIPKKRHTNSSSRFLSWENQLLSHPGYVKAAFEASKFYSLRCLAQE